MDSRAAVPQSAHPSWAVALEHVSFTYAGSERPALRDVTLRIPPGQFVAVMGETGAGKSTLVKCLNRTVPVFQPGRLEGEIRLDGKSIGAASVADVAGRVGMVLQDFEAQLFATDVEQEVAFGLEQLGVAAAEMRSRIHRALELVGLAGFERRDPTTLSGGEKQRLAIAAVLAMQPPLLVFDEPTTDLDPEGKQEIFRLLAAMRTEGHTAVVVEHEIDAADSADRIVLLHEGRIVADGPAREVRREVSLLLRHGVRPRDLDRIGVAFSLPPETDTLDAVEAALRRRGVVLGPAPQPHPSAGAPLIEVEAVRFGYGDQPVLQDVSLSLRRGDFAALIGRNGCGKSTLAKLMNGLLQPDRGHVLLGGVDVSSLSLSGIASRVGYVFQDPDQQLFAASVGEEIAFGPRNLGLREPDLSQRVAEAIAAVGLEGLEETDPFLLAKGQRQRLAVAALLAQRPDVLLLDEPTTGLDFFEQTKMMRLLLDLHQRGLTIVVITHSPWVVAEHARRGIVLCGGGVVYDGPLRDLFRRDDILRDSRFRTPDVNRLARRFGSSLLSVEEFGAAAGITVAAETIT